MAYEDTLGAVPLFSHLSSEALSRLAKSVVPRKYPAGATIVGEGEQAVAFYVIVSGKVEVSKGGQLLNTLGAGDFFGEMSLLDGEPRSADARAHGGPLTVLALDEPRVREVLSMDAAAALEFLRLLCRLLADRLREIDEKVIGWRILAGGQAESASA
jgi:CRP-like cAMP-binding protein